jgi:hypothetical protein
VTGNRRAATLAAALLLAAGVAACGGSSGGSDNGIAGKSPEAIVTATTKAAEAAKSVEVSGSMTQGGTNVGLDLKMVAHVGATGWVSEQGKRFNMVLDGNVLYIKAGTAFWTSFGNAAVAKVLEGKWLKTPATGSYASVAKLGDLQTFFTEVFGHHGALSKTGTKTIDGTKVVGLRDAKQGGVLYVATTGKPYPIELNGDAGSGSGKLSFSGYGNTFKITPPADSVSLTQLEQAG